MMKLVVGVVVLLLGMMGVTVAGRQGRRGNEDVREKFVGGWRLVSLQEVGADGIQKADCSGLLVYTRGGHMSVQVMYRNPPAGTSAAPVQYAQGGYEASFGTYQIEDAHTFAFHVEGALVRSLVGKDLKRVYEISGTQLIVKSANPEEHWRVVWERD
jgi:hypothetical protein